MIITPNWQLPSGFNAFYTTRQQGASLPPFDQFNLGLHVGDDTANVLVNRQQLPMASSIGWLQQSHSSKVIELTADAIAAIPLAGDAAFSRTANLVCAVMTADCLPILIADDNTSQVAAIHAGWRGLADGIIEQTIKKMACSNNARVWIGPAISQAHFEVGVDVLHAFQPAEQDYFVATAKQGKWLADLPAIATARCRQQGIADVTNSALCTYSQAEKFYSYRREGHTGRMLTAIWRNPD